jgi:HK97 family phage major capsid protein
MATSQRKIKSAPLQRSYTLDRQSVDADARTVELAFSSETRDVERWFGVEVLDHSPGAVRLGRISDGGPLLVDHDPRDQVGVVENASVSADRRGRAAVRFGNSARAQEIFQDVQDGIRRHVSVSYRVHAMVLESREDDEEIYRVTDWEPLEISLVSVPADHSVGVGRAAGDEHEIEVTTMVDEVKKEEKTAAESRGAQDNTPKVDVKQIENDVRERELKRISDLESIGTRYAKLGGQDLAREMISKGKSVEDLRAAILERLPKTEDAGSGEAPATALGMGAREVQRYSLLRAIRAAAKNNWKEAGFELECSQAIAEQLGREARGFFVPFEVQQRSESRSMTTSTTGDMVGTDHMAGAFIDVLRPNSVVMSLGATTLTGLVGDVDIPAQEGTSTFYWLGDDADVTDSDVDMRTVSLSPTTVAGSVPISRRLMKQSSPSVEMLIQRDLAVGAALAIDLAALQGTGANDQPTGVVNTTGVSTQTVSTAGAPTWNELVGFETKVNTENALQGSLAYVTTAPVIGNMKTTKKDAGSGIFLLENGLANGYRVAQRNGIAANRMIFGNWSDVLVGMWGVLDVMPDPAAKAASGGLVLRVFQDVDVAVRHAESFCINA